MKIRVTVVKIPVGKSHVHRLIDRVNILRTVISHFLQIEIFQDIQTLQQNRALCPRLQFVHIDSLVIHMQRFFFNRSPPRQVFHRDQSSLLARTAYKLPGNVALVKAIIGGHYSILPVFPRFQCLLFGIHQFV
jgi:hypothetical protein